MSSYRATVAWSVLHRGAIKKVSATFSHAASTDRCLDGRYVNSLRSDTLLPSGMLYFIIIMFNLCITCASHVVNCRIYVLANHRDSFVGVMLFIPCAKLVLLLAAMFYIMVVAVFATLFLCCHDKPLGQIGIWP